MLPAELAPELSIVIAIARMPEGRMAERKPPLPLISLSLRIGSPARKLWRAIEPTMSVSAAGSALRTIMFDEMAVLGQTCQRKSVFLASAVPIGTSLLATRTSSVGRTGAGSCVTTWTGAGLRPARKKAPAPEASAMTMMARRAGFMTTFWTGAPWPRPSGRVWNPVRSGRQTGGQLRRGCAAKGQNMVNEVCVFLIDPMGVGALSPAFS